MLKLHVPKFHQDPSVRLKDIAEKLVPVMLKPIVVSPCLARLKKIALPVLLSPF